MKLMCLHFKTMEVPYEGPHDVITLVADRPGRCILALRLAPGQWKSSRDSLINCCMRELARLWCKQPPDLLSHIHCPEQTESSCSENQFPLSPQNWAMLHCLCVCVRYLSAISNPTKTVGNIKEKQLRDHKNKKHQQHFSFLTPSLYIKECDLWESRVLLEREQVINYSCGQLKGHYKSLEFLNCK